MKKSCYKGTVEEVITNSFLPSKLRGHFDEEDSFPRPLSFFHIFEAEDMEWKTDLWNEVELWTILDRDYRGTYQRLSIDQLDYSEEGEGKIAFFQGGDLDSKRFSLLIKMFMGGERVVLDKRGLSEELNKRLEH